MVSRNRHRAYPGTCAGLGRLSGSPDWRPRMITRRDFAALAGATAVAGRARAQGAPLVALEQVAQFEMQVTGVAVAESGRIFVNFPRWEQDVPISVAEVGRDGSLKPYPNAEWNAWRNERKLSNEDHFVCVQSVTADRQGFLWILDPAAPGNEFNLDRGPKLVKVDLKTDRVVRTYLFDRTAVPQGSYVNDVRISPDGQTAYMTDSGVRGALLVLDLVSGKAKRVLDGATSTQVEGDVVVMADGKPLKRPDGRGPAFAADGIALDPKGESLYWQALAGRTLYQVPTSALPRKPSRAPPSRTPTRPTARPSVRTRSTPWRSSSARPGRPSASSRRRAGPSSRRRARRRPSCPATRTRSTSTTTTKRRRTCKMARETRRVPRQGFVREG